MQVWMAIGCDVYNDEVGVLSMITVTVGLAEVREYGACMEGVKELEDIIKLRGGRSKVLKLKWDITTMAWLVSSRWAGWLVYNGIIPSISFADEHVDGADFSGARLDRADFNTAVVANVDFSSAELWKCNFRGAAVRNCKFSNTTLAGANFNDTCVFGCNFSAASSQGFSARGASFEDSVLPREGDFTGAYLMGTTPTPYGWQKNNDHDGRLERSK